jgi:hypothetical protein
MQEMHRVEAILIKIVGVLVILLGLLLFASPQVTYTRRESAIHSETVDVTARRQKTLMIPRPVSVAIVTAGVVTLILASRNQRR